MKRSVMLVVLVTMVCSSLALGGCRRQAADDAPQPVPTSPAPSVQPTTTTTEPTQPPQAVRPVEPHLNKAAANVYFLSGEKLAAAHRTVDAPAVASSALKALLAGPTATEKDQGLTSSIPAGTKLRSIKLSKGTATVDLSGAFASGGGSLSMLTRVGQVVHTLTQFPSVKQVRFRIDGEPVEALGGEGIVLIEPQGRADYEDVSPVVLVERPAWGASVKTGEAINISGTANTFEAEFNLELTDGNGLIVAEKQVMASSGSGTRGVFSASVTMPGNARTGWGALIAWFTSAEDGSRVVVSEIPLRVEAPAP